MAVPNTEKFNRIRQAVINAVNYYDQVTQALVHNFCMQNDIEVTSQELGVHIENLKKEKIIKAVHKFRGASMVWYLEPSQAEAQVPVEMFIVNLLAEKSLRRTQIISRVILKYGVTFMRKDKISALIDRLVEIKSISSYTPIDRSQPVFTPVLDDIDVEGLDEVEYEDEEE
ncbi:MAG: hypothetical protein COA82_03505 [Alkaliphilus sp.]|nr:MAG: hypothetical protein COA82_03505 [Alkaliphilus sp.]